MKRPASADRAFVLRLSPYGEADVVVQLLTESAGALSAIAKRARAGGKRTIVLEPFHTLRVELARGSGDLDNLRSSAIDVARAQLLEDPTRLDAAGLATRWVRTLSPRRVAEPEVFAALERALDALVEGAAPRSVTTAFGLELLETLGYGLELRGCAKCARARPPGKPAYVSGAAGGVLCETCRRGVAFASSLVPGALLDRVAEDPWLLLVLPPDESAALTRAVEDAIAAHARSFGAREGSK